MSVSDEFALWVDQLIPVIHEAGEAVMEVYASDFRVEVKDDQSPVTAADECAERLITRALAALTPTIPIVAEEASAAGRAVAVTSRFWLVDPLDGTREFVNRNGEFTVNIALVDQGRPVLGLVLLPVSGRLYGGLVGMGSWLEEGGLRRTIRSRRAPTQGLTVLSSRSHGDEAAMRDFLADLPVSEIVFAGSSLKLCLLAEGVADLYPRFGRTMEWDIAAGQAVLEAAGGRVTCLDGALLRYGKPGFENPDFVAWGAA